MLLFRQWTSSTCLTISEHPAVVPAIYAAPAPAIENVASALANKFVASVPMIEYVAPAPVSPGTSRPCCGGSTGAVIEKTVEFLVVQSAQSNRTLPSLETVPVCEMRLVVTVEMVELGSLLPAVPVSPLSMTAPVVDVPPVMVEQRVDELNIENSVG